MGVGYQYVGDVLNDSLTLKLMLTLLVLKLVATAVSYASGNAGGIFGPSLFLGAMLGGAVGSVAQHFFPGSVASPGAYALVGMGTAFAGIVRAPMTSVVMIFEITRDYAVIVPLMISNLVSFFVASRFQKEPIYEVLAHQDGIHLPTAETRAMEGNRRVLQAMRAASETLSADATLRDAMAKTRASALSAWPVVSHQGVIGVLGREAIEAAAKDGDADKKLNDLISGNQDFPHVHADHSLNLALHRMGSAGLDALPVVNRANVHQMLGIVTVDDILALYRVRPFRERRCEERRV